jgi:hypothetical protein
MDRSGKISHAGRSERNVEEWNGIGTNIEHTSNNTIDNFIAESTENDGLKFDSKYSNPGPWTNDSFRNMLNIMYADNAPKSGDRRGSELLLQLLEKNIL